MRRKVRELVRAGADVIKVATSGGVLSPTDDPRHAHFRDDELTALVTEAAAAGRWVKAHADSFRRAVAAGVKVAMGTDSGITPHGRNLAELATLPERIAAVVKDGRLVAGHVGTVTAVSARAAWPAGGAAPGTATPG